MEATAPVSNVDSEKAYTNNTSGRPLAASLPFHTYITVLRYLTFATTLTAFCVMITNKQAVLFPFAGTHWAKYHYSDAFMWFVIANCMAFIYSLLTALLFTFSKSPKLASSLLVLDLLMTYIIISGASSATAIAYIGDRGLEQTRWNAICATFVRYCHHVAGSLIASYLGWVFLTVATILSGMQRYRV